MRAPVLESLAGAYARLRAVMATDLSVEQFARRCEDCIRDDVHGHYHAADNGIRALHSAMMDVDRSTIHADPHNPRAMEEAVLHIGNALLRSVRWQLDPQ